MYSLRRYTISQSRSTLPPTAEPRFQTQRRPNISFSRTRSFIDTGSGGEHGRECMGSSIPTCEASDTFAQGARYLHKCKPKKQATEANGTFERAGAATLGAANITTPMTDNMHKNGQEDIPSSNNGSTQAAATTERRRLEMMDPRTPGTKARASGIPHRPGPRPTHSHHISHKPYSHHMHARIYMGLH